MVLSSNCWAFTLVCLTDTALSSLVSRIPHLDPRLISALEVFPFFVLQTVRAIKQKAPTGLQSRLRCVAGLHPTNILSEIV